MKSVLSPSRGCGGGTFTSQRVRAETSTRTKTTSAGAAVQVLVSARTLWEVNVPPPQPREGDNTLFITVVGRQWWWEYRYDRYNGRELGFTTANELHIPAGEKGVPRPVYLTLKSADVCHSFGVPRLGGKTDLIPGRTNSMWFQT